ncbi:M9 family metallopeptidase [Undibacterium fentianense]|uniref:microbial collagenase n=1 Tax=Undibacterium fentianense TaxID=2828728 RepID=A0A941E0W5_9BURK|nr:M9 family metallopeptidase [Undibacterium fentianense]MBR7799002.1 collagenase [Undibacterium fentianense]
MSMKRNSIIAVAILAANATSMAPVNAAIQSEQAERHEHEHKALKQAPRPHARMALPPSAEQVKFNLPQSKKDVQALYRTNNNSAATKTAPSMAPLMAPAPTAACKDMTTLANYSGAALANYLVSLPDPECTYGLFSLTSAQGAGIYSATNMNAVASRFTQEASSYNASNIALVNLTLYLRAGYYLASGGTIVAPSSTVMTNLRAPIKQLIDGSALYASNAAWSNTASEVFKLITNLNDEAYYLPSVKNVFVRYTNTASNPNAANGLLQTSAAGALTGALTVMFYAHDRANATSIIQDASYPTVLNNFVVNNKAALLNTSTAYQLSDAENEAFRFMKYAALLNTVKPMVKNQLATSTMTGPDSDLWLNAASAVDYYDSANCAEYGTCGYQTKLADAVLKTSYTCSPTIKIRAQDMTPQQLQDSCNILGAEETYFHKMLLTNNTPLPNDNNKSLELVVFDDYTNYSKYAGAIYGIGTDNGGMYLEGNPADVNNQARFIAHEASWLRPTFSVWNLEHEYVHYLDGRFDMAGDFAAGTAKPTVWWIEGVAEYLSHKNNYQEAIDAAKTGTYKLSTILGNTYSMSDYVTRAYRWGYMAVRFMNERHRSDIDAMIAKFRSGDYAGYQTYLNNIGTRYDTEFANWVQTVTVAGEPPLPTVPVVTLPTCASSSQLGKNCAIKNLTSNSQAYLYIMLPTGAKNLKLYTNGGTGDVDLYVKKGSYPTTSSYDAASVKAGNDENVLLPTPSSGVWYYIVLRAKQAFTGVNINATYD